MNTADNPTCPIDGEPPLREIVAELASGAYIHIDDSNCYELRRHGKPIGSHTLNFFLVRNGWVQSTPNGGSYVLTDEGRLAYLRSTDELGNGELVAPSSHRDARHAAAELVAVHPAEMMDTEVQTAHPVVGLPCKILLRELHPDHDGQGSECPGCTAYRKLVAMQTIPKLAPATTKEK